MSYHRTASRRRQPLQGLGYVITIGTPIGDQRISIPLEQMTHDAGQMAIDAAWPPMKEKLEAEMPVLIDKLKAEVPGLLQTALTAAQTQVVTKMWPALQPKVRAELDYGLTEGKKVAWMVGGAVILAVIMAAGVTRKRDRAAAAAAK